MQASDADTVDRVTGILEPFPKERRTHRRILGSISFVILLFVYLPLLVVVAMSFNASTSSTSISGLSFRWYGEFLRNDDLISALRNSILVAAATTAGSLLLGCSSAIALHRLRFRGRRLYEGVLLMPFVLPEMVTGLSLLIFFTAFRVPLSLVTVTIGHILFTMSVAHRTIGARLLSMPPNLEEASVDLGASWARTLRKVTLPYLGDSFIAAALLVFTISFDQTVITIMVTGTANTLPMVIWSTLRRGFTPTVNAVAAVIFLVSLVLVVGIAGFTRRAER